MKPSLRRLLVSVLSAVALAACGSSSNHATVPSGGSQIDTTARHRPGTTLYVGRWTGVHHAYRTIQAAVDAARPGDWILVGAGDYHESPGSRDGVRITTPNIHLRGLTRSGVIVDGTRPGAPEPCDPLARWQNLGPGRAGRNGIVVTASGVSVENLTVCNFVGGGQGRQVAFDGGFGTGKVGLGAFEGSYLTATSTFASRSQPGVETRLGTTWPGNTPAPCGLVLSSPVFLALTRRAAPRSARVGLRGARGRFRLRRRS